MSESESSHNQQSESEGSPGTESEQEIQFEKGTFIAYVDSSDGYENLYLGQVREVLKLTLNVDTGRCDGGRTRGRGGYLQ